MSASAHRRVLDRIANAAERLGSGLDIDAGRFARSYFSDLSTDDLTASPPEHLAAAALGHLEFARQRRPGSPSIRVFNPTEARDGWSSEHTVVEMVNDDMPFLVDSSTMALADLGQRIHVTIHPVLRIARNARGRLAHIAGSAGARESLIHIEIVRETDPGALREIEQRLAATLSDVRAAVEDWPRMLEALREASSGIGRYARVARPLLAECRAFLDWLSDDHFTLLGYRELVLKRRGAADELHVVPNTGLGILRDARSKATTVRLSGEARREARSSNPLVITKSNSRSTVHRTGYLDYIAVKVFDRSGRPKSNGVSSAFSHRARTTRARATCRCYD